MSLKSLFGTLGLLAAPLVCSGCVTVTSREPLYDAKKDRVFDDGLVGTWIAKGQDEDQMCWRLERDGLGGYLVSDLTPENQPADDSAGGDEAETHGTIGVPADLVRLDCDKFLFLKQPTWTNATGEGTVWPPEALNMPWCRVERSATLVRVWFLNGDCMREILKREPGGLRHEFQPSQPASDSQPDVRIVAFESGTLRITDSAKNVRRFLYQHRKDEGFWAGPIEFQRAHEQVRFVGER